MKPSDTRDIRMLANVIIGGIFGRIRMSSIANGSHHLTIVGYNVTQL